MKNRQRIVHVANYLDEATGEAFEEFEFPTLDGFGRLTVPRAQTLITRDLYGEMVGHNLDTTLATQNDLEQAVRRSPKKLISFAKGFGWQNGYKAYVTATTVVGDSGSSRKLRPPRTNVLKGCQAKKGTRDSWVAEVARPCGHSRIATFFLCVSFAPPLLRLLNWPSYGFNLFGEQSKVGKSTIVLAAASVHGDARESDLRNWASTEAAFDESFKLYNDALLAINETGLIRGSGRKAYDVLRQSIYAVSEGRRYQRHSQSSFTESDEQLQHALIFVSTAEHPIAHYAAQAKMIQNQGELSRCIDIPVLDRSRNHVCDLPPRELSERQRITYTDSWSARIRAGCERNGGVAPITDFTRAIIANPRKAIALAREESRSFLDSLNYSELDAIDKHRAQCFAIAYAAGAMAAKKGLIPQNKAHLMKVARGFFRRAQSVRDTTRTDPTMARRLLWRQLQTLPPEDKFFTNASGFVRSVEDGKQFIVRCSIMRSWFDDIAFSAVVRSLEDARSIVPVASRTQRNDTRRLEHTLRWPDGKMVRCFVLAGTKLNC